MINNFNGNKLSGLAKAIKVIRLSNIINIIWLTYDLHLI